MGLVVRLADVQQEDRGSIGSKGYCLAMLARSGLRVPRGICVRAEAYARYVTETGLRHAVTLELARKEFDQMRWEEIWDASLRIRNLLSRTAIPEALRGELRPVMDRAFDGRNVVVRSSALAEDAAGTSFAGLHESFVNITGADAILDHIRLVWASLFSDAALLYRQEMGLDVHSSAMAVVVQELIHGQCAGVAFGRNPNDTDQAIIESVHGLNEGMVDGTVPPDQWLIDRATGRIVAHTPAERTQAVFPAENGTELRPLADHLRATPPISPDQVLEVFELTRRAEDIFGKPQDVEWTFSDGSLCVLQSRPITTIRPQESQEEDRRAWYLSLRRSLENLKALRRRIEGELIPEMIRQTDLLAGELIEALADEELADNIDRRAAIQRHWADVYWDDFIPFAHGIRLFGQVYGDRMRPQDPYEFVDLLSGTSMESLARNRRLADLVRRLREHPDQAAAMAREDWEAAEELIAAVDEFGDAYGTPALHASDLDRRRRQLTKVLMQMAQAQPAPEKTGQRDVAALTQAFLARFGDDRRAWAEDLLDLARASYRLRDDDNIYLGRIEAQLERATAEARRRLEPRGLPRRGAVATGELIRALREPDYIPAPVSAQDAPPADRALKARQLVGQPAGPGVARGPARVLRKQADLYEFKQGEVLVCDAVDPNMTFVVPLCSAIAERRGGMLIHGAIIAREYGIPCVTGVPELAELVQTGDQLSVDGYLGIVTILSRAQTGNSAAG